MEDSKSKRVPKTETKKLGIGDLDNLVGSKTIASFTRFVAGPEAKKALTVREITGLSGGRVMASFARFVAAGDKVLEENRYVDVHDGVRTVADFDALEEKLSEKDALS